MVDVKPSGDKYSSEPTVRPGRHVFRVRLAPGANGRTVVYVRYLHDGKRQTLTRQEFLSLLAKLLGQSPDDIRLEGKTIYTRSGLTPKGERQGNVVVMLSFKHNRHTPISYPINVF